jgi:hypothetical protein
MVKAAILVPAICEAEVVPPVGMDPVAGATEVRAALAEVEGTVAGVVEGPDIVGM